MKHSSPLMMLMIKYISRADAERLEDLLSEMHRFDVRRSLARLEPPTRAECFRLLDSEILSEIISDMDEDDQIEAFSLMTDEKMRDVLNDMPIDDVVDVLGVMNDDEVRDLLPQLEEQEEVSRLMAFALDSAAGLMTTEFISIAESLTVQEAIQVIQHSADDAETIYYIYVVDDKNRPVGVLSLRELLAAGWVELIRDVMKENLVTVEEGVDQEDVAHIIAKYDLLAVPVVNRNGEISGIITVDDIVDVIEEESTEDLFKMAGLIEQGEDNDEFRSARLIQSDLGTILRIRLPWLLLALVGGMIAGGVIGAFEEVLETIVALAFFIPVIMDMGGNVGTQSSTIFVRGFALGHVDRDRFFPYLFGELKVGLSLGAISGFLVALMAYVWQRNVVLALIVSASMAFTVVLATLIGFAIPWGLAKMNWDPAAGSDPLITTIKDVTGLMIYFSLAGALMQYL